MFNALQLNRVYSQQADMILLTGQTPVTGTWFLKYPISSRKRFSGKALKTNDKNQVKLVNGSNCLKNRLTFKATVWDENKIVLGELVALNHVVHLWVHTNSLSAYTHQRHTQQVSQLSQVKHLWAAEGKNAGPENGDPSADNIAAIGICKSCTVWRRWPHNKWFALLEDHTEDWVSTSRVNVPPDTI